MLIHMASTDKLQAISTKVKEDPTTNLPNHTVSKAAKTTTTL